MPKTFKRGARPTPKPKMLSAEPFMVPVAVPPAQVAYVPAKLSIWGNGNFGDCVSAEEAFAKGCYGTFVPNKTVVNWAAKHGFLNGADLLSVMQTMQKNGFFVSGKTYDDGTPQGVDYTNQGVLQAAIAQGPVKIAIDANALPATAGQQQGWSMFGGNPKQFPNTDHCVSVAGYGAIPWLAQQLGVPVPAKSPASFGYLVFTWATIGIVDFSWLMSTCVEAWVRNPTTVVASSRVRRVGPAMVGGPAWLDVFLTWAKQTIAAHGPTVAKAILTAAINALPNVTLALKAELVSLVNGLLSKRQLVA